MNLTKSENGMRMASTADHLMMVILICLICILVLLIGVCCRVAMKSSSEGESFLSTSDNLSGIDNHECPTGENLHYAANNANCTVKTNTVIVGSRKDSQVWNHDFFPNVIDLIFSLIHPPSDCGACTPPNIISIMKLVFRKLITNDIDLQTLTKHYSQKLNRVWYKMINFSKTTPVGKRSQNIAIFRSVAVKAWRKNLITSRF